MFKVRSRQVCMNPVARAVAATAMKRGVRDMHLRLHGMPPGSAVAWGDMDTMVKTIAVVCTAVKDVEGDLDGAADCVAAMEQSLVALLAMAEAGRVMSREDLGVVALGLDAALLGSQVLPASALAMAWQRLEATPA